MSNNVPDKIKPFGTLRDFGAGHLGHYETFLYGHRLGPFGTLRDFFLGHYNTLWKIFLQALRAPPPSNFQNFSLGASRPPPPLLENFSSFPIKNLTQNCAQRSLGSLAHRCPGRSLLKIGIGECITPHLPVR